MPLSDQLSPMLIKELRQGMRSRVFLTAFLLVQAAMIFSVLVSLLEVVNSPNPSDSDLAFSGGLFWFTALTPLIILGPLRGFFSLSREIKANTLELVFLTRLTARGIVLGKWASLMAQALLLVTAIIPYLLLRYFIGSVNILTDLLVVGLTLLVSSLFTLLGVALSPYRSWLMRLAFLAGGGSLFLSSISALSFGVSLLEATFLWSLIPLSLLLTILCTELGASNIAPPAANHALGKRLACLLLIPVSLLLLLPGTDQCRALAAVALLLPVPFLVDALCETTHPISSLYTPWMKLGPLGLLGRRLLTPGWHSGLLYVLLHLALILALILLSTLAPDEIFPGFHRPSSDDVLHACLALAALASAIITPFALLRPLLRRVNGLQWHGIFLLACLVQYILMGLIATIGQVLGAGDAYQFVCSPLPLPTLALLLSDEIHSSGNLTFFLIVNLAILAASLLILLIHSLPGLRAIRQAENTPD